MFVSCVCGGGGGGAGGSEVRQCYVFILSTCFLSSFLFLFFFRKLDVSKRK